MPRDDAQKHDDIQEPLLERRAFLSTLLAGMAGMPLLLRSEAANAAVAGAAGGATVGAQPSNDPAHLPKMIRASARHGGCRLECMAIDVRDLSSGRTLCTSTTGFLMRLHQRQSFSRRSLRLSF